MKNKISDLVSEYKKIHWPKKDEIINMTLIVLLVTFLLSMMMLAFDVIFVRFLSTVTNFLKSFIN